MTEGSIEALNELREKLWRIGGIHHGYSYFAEALEYYNRALKVSDAASSSRHVTPPLVPGGHTRREANGLRCVFSAVGGKGWGEG